MKNYVQNGDMVYAIAPAGGVLSGNGYQVGVGIFGDAGAAAAQGETYALWVSGIFILAKASQTWAAGDIIYWDNTAKVATNVVATNLRIGIATKAVATAGVLTGEVRLSGF